MAQAAMRRQWRSLLVVTLLVGIAGAAVLTAAAGARRTASSLDRFQSESRAADLELDVGTPTLRQLDALRRVANVDGVGVLYQLILTLPNHPQGPIIPAAAAVDETFGTDVDRPRVIHGRLPTPTRVHEVAIGETFASQRHLHIGDDARFDSYSVAQVIQQTMGQDPGAAAGPQITFHIVGIVRRPLDLGVRGASGGIVVATPAFYARYHDQIGSYVGDLLRVRATHGATDVPAITRAARRIFRDADFFQAIGVAPDTQGARDAISVLAAALWVFAGVAAIAGVGAIGIVTVRQVGSQERDEKTLAALGLTMRQRAIAAGSLAIPAAIGGGALAVIGAALLSPLVPFGIAGKAEPDPGFHIDGLVLGLGLMATVSFVLLVAAVAAWRVARSAARRRDELGLGRPSAAARIAASAGATPRVTTGLRLALEPGRGPNAVPVRSAFVGGMLGTLGIVALLVFAGSLEHLVATPRLYGWSFDTSLVARTAPEPNSKVCGDVTTSITDNPIFRSVASICLQNVEVDGDPVTVWGFISLRGSIEPSIVNGRAARTPNEVALGKKALDAIGKHVGDTVKIRGESKAVRFHIVGQVVLPVLQSDSPEPLADSAAMTATGFTRLFPHEDNPNLSIVARFARGVDVARIPRTTSGLFKFGTGSNAVAGTPPSRPVEVDRLRPVDDLPAILGALLGVLAMVAVAHAIILAIRRRRRDLAVLRTLGFERRDVRATIAYQATTLAVLGLIVGVPAGFAVGRVAWRAVADGIGVSPVTDVSVLALVAVAVGALLVANLIGSAAATAAIHDRPATVLAAE
jgi:hypothetical protein